MYQEQTVGFEVTVVRTLMDLYCGIAIEFRPIERVKAIFGKFIFTQV